MADETMTLLPCPFCGETGVTVVEGSTFRWMFAACDHCGASCGEVRVQTHGDGTPEQWREQGKRDAIAEWNRRAPAIDERKVAEWQPIETAPRDETPVDLWCPDRGERITNMVRCEWSPDNVFYKPLESGPSCVRTATHWMPLPAAPKVTP